MKVYKIFGFVAVMALLSSCDYQKYNKKEAQPELDTRVNAIREKLYGGATSAVVKE